MVLSPQGAALAFLISLLSLAGGIATVALVPSAAGSFSAASGGEAVTVIGALIFALSFSGVGFIVARRQPRNPMGWLLLGVALAVEVGSFAPGYAYLDYGRHHGSLPLGALAVAFSGVWVLLFVLPPLVILLFPDGRLDRRWRWPLRAYLLIAGGLFATAVETAISDIGLRLPVDDQGNLAGLDHTHGWVSAMFGIALFSAVLTSLAAIVRQALRYRRADSGQRQQLKWLMAGAIVCLAAGALAIGNSTGVVAELLVPVGLAFLPLGMGVAILRYRLYEIDRLVSRTLAYALLTALLVGTFVGLVALSTDILALSGRVGVAASTLAAAALFNPLRIRIQRLVDRRFNRARYDAEATVADFTARLRDAVEIDAIRRDLLETVHRAVHPTHASIWIKP